MYVDRLLVSTLIDVNLGIGLALVDLEEGRRERFAAGG
jgi:hypothetical protein